jgi:hypothetical protein
MGSFYRSRHELVFATIRMAIESAESSRSDSQGCVRTAAGGCRC